VGGASRRRRGFDSEEVVEGVICDMSVLCGLKAVCVVRRGMLLRLEEGGLSHTGKAVGRKMP
jgi:hypothetical protein